MICANENLRGFVLFGVLALYNAKARAWFKHNQNADWILSDRSRFETVNALRSLCLRPQGPKLELVEALRRYFNHLLTHGPFGQERVDWSEVVRDAH